MKKQTKNSNAGIEKRLDKIISLLENRTKTSLDVVAKSGDNLSPSLPSKQNESDLLRITFPKMNLKEIFEKSKGKTINGYPLVWNFEDNWIRKEKFFTKEYTSPGEKVLDLTWMGQGKSWNECKELTKKEGKRILNMAEIFYVIWKHDEVAKKLLASENNPCYTWSSTPVGGDVGCAGDWGSVGPRAGRRDARGEWDDLGLLFSCTDL